MDSTPATSPSACTRRRILGWSSMGALGGLATYLGWPSDKSTRGGNIPAATKRQAVATPPAMPGEAQPVADAISREDFLPHLNSQFRVDGTDCTLVEVSTAQQMVSPSAEFTSFSLLFAGPSGFVAESRSYSLEHAKMGEMSLFLSPVGLVKDRVYLEAVLSHRV
jgi:hypothetical protein